MESKLRLIRLEKGQTQENIAFELGISQKAYSEIENGKVRLSQDKLKKICQILEIKPSDICSLGCQCTIDNNKFEKLVKYFEEKGLEIPHFLKQ